MAGFIRGRLRVVLAAAGIIAGAIDATPQTLVVVEGIVADVAGTSASGVTVTLRDRNRPTRAPRVAVSDVHGKFRLPDVPRGDYVVSVENRRRKHVEVQTIRLGEEPTRHLRLTLPGTATASRRR